ncbi:hypothetical protein JCM33374_g1634 [Metschnikowia sp. JCM 33374]|nr:hypothetical protein JCM33374_g1634 [Metschnikowia sp. JCM 33374]
MCSLTFMTRPANGRPVDSPTKSGLRNMARNSTTAANSPILTISSYNISSLIPGIYLPGEPMISEDEELDVSLERLFVHLSAQAAKPIFDVERFEAERDTVSQILDMLSQRTQELTPSIALASKLQFLKSLFQEMTKYTDQLRHCSHLNVRGARLLYKVIEVQIQALAFHDSRGNLAKQDVGYAEKVKRLTERLYDWGEKFYKLPDVPKDARALFNLSFGKAESALIFLRGSLPRG